jgi:drug/metabolite transporter (DMT)-like permease
MRTRPLKSEKSGIQINPAGFSASSLSIWGAMLAVYIVWGSTYLAIRFAIETLPPFLMASTRFLIAGSILYAFRRLRGDAAPTRVEWRSAAIVGVLLLVSGNGGVVWAEQFVESGVAALLVGSAPLWMVLLDVLRPAQAHLARRSTDKRSRLLTTAGVVLGFLGIGLLVSPSSLTGLAGEIDPIGSVVLTLAAFSWATGSLYSRGARLPCSPLLGTGMEMLVGGAGLLLLGTLVGEWGRVDLSTVSARSLLSLGYLIIFGSLVGFAAYTWLLRVAPTALVSTYAYVNPLVAILLGNLLAQEPLSARVLIATAIILGAVAVITLNQPSRRKAEPRPEMVAAPPCGDD